MAVVDDIDAVHGRPDLTQGEKRKQIAALRSSAGRDSLLSQPLPRTFAVPPYVIRIFAVGVAAVRDPLTNEPLNDALWLTVGVTRLGVAVPLGNPIVLAPPPLLVHDAAGEVDRGNGRRFRYDPDAAIRDTIVTHLRSLAP